MSVLRVEVTNNFYLHATLPRVCAEVAGKIQIWQGTLMATGAFHWHDSHDPLITGHVSTRQQPLAMAGMETTVCNMQQPKT